MIIHIWQLSCKYTTDIIFEVDMDCIWTGNYNVSVEYGGCAVQGSPFTVKSFDISKIKVLGVSDGVIGLTSSFAGKFCEVT